MSSAAPSRDVSGSLAAQSDAVRARDYALLDALRAANLRCQEILAAQARMEGAALSLLCVESSESALVRLKMAIRAESRPRPGGLPPGDGPAADDARSTPAPLRVVMPGAPQDAPEPRRR
jgi:hypothetical protein